MPKKIGCVDKSVLINAALPPQTKTYTVISHQYAINTIEKALKDNGFEVESEEYRCATGAKVATGKFIVNYAEDPDLKMMYAFSNSYDKSLRFRASIGAMVTANEAYMVNQIDLWNRKHTGTADNETEKLINRHISNAKVYFGQLQEAKESMKSIHIDKRTFGQMIGELFITECLSIDQVSTIAKEYAAPSFNYSTPANNLWTCYNHIIHSLRSSHPSNWMQNQIAVHLFFVSRYDLVQFDDDNAEDENVTHDAENNQDPELPNINDGIEVLAPEDVPQLEEVIEEEELEVIDPNQLSIEESNDEEAALEDDGEDFPEILLEDDLPDLPDAGATPVAKEEVVEEAIDTPVAVIADAETAPEEVILPTATEEEASEMLYGVDNNQAPTPEIQAQVDADEKAVTYFQTRRTRRRASVVKIR